MNKFGVSEQKAAALENRMRQLSVREEDIEESFIRGSGPGGQKINKSASCVQLQHRSSGAMVRCQRERSLALNRFLARRILCDQIEKKVTGEIAKEKSRIEKIRRQKRRRSRRAKLKMLADKHHRSEKKLHRKIQIFQYDNIHSIKNKELANNIVNGTIIEGFVEVIK